jgi:hypothetical protein
MDTGSYQASNIFITSVAAIHTIHIRNRNGCTVDTAVSLYPAGIREEAEVSYMAMAPNPAAEISYLHIMAAQAFAAQIRITDMAGREVYGQPIPVHNGLQQVQIDASGFSDGMYLVSLSRGDKTLRTIRMVVVR